VAQFSESRCSNGRSTRQPQLSYQNDRFFGNFAPNFDLEVLYNGKIIRKDLEDGGRGLVVVVVNKLDSSNAEYETIRHTSNHQGHGNYN
jgi:hypothetical protein